MKRVICNVMVLILTMALAACGQQTTGDSGSTQSTEGSNQSTVGVGSYKVGVILGLSGVVSSLGEPMLQGIQLELDEVNASGILSRPIELVVEDDRSDEAQSVAIANSYIADDEVLAIIGGSGSANCLAVAERANVDGILQVCDAAAEPITNPVREWTFSVFPTARFQVLALIEWLQTRGIQNVAVLHESSAFGESAAGVAEEELASAGLTMTVRESYLQEDRDMTGQLARAQAAGSEAIVDLGTTESSAAVVRGVRAMSWAVPTISSTGTITPEFPDLVGEAGEGHLALAESLVFTYTGLPEDDPDRRRLQEMSEEFESRHGRAIDMMASGGVDMLGLVAEAIRVVEETGADVNRTTLRDAYESISGYSGLMGDYDISPDDHIGLAGGTSLVTLRDGEWEVYLLGSEIVNGEPGGPLTNPVVGEILP